MVVYDSFKNPLDVVFVIEATANLGAYIDVLKKHYIIPTLELFNGGPPDPTDYGHDYSCTLYNMVTFFSFDIHPDATARCSDITTNIHEFITWLDDVPFTGGGSDTSSYIAEGLSTALHVFDDLEQQRRVKGQQIQKHCILVCNSPPYQLPSMESLKYSGFMSEQLAKMMAQRGINLSIISPRKIPALLKLYEESTMPGDLGVPTKDFSTDPRHHILLHGYQLQERAHSPVNDVSEPAHSPAPGFAVPTSAFSPAPPPSFDDSQTLSGGFKVPSSAPTAPSSSYSTNQMPSPLSMSSSMPSPQQVTTQQGMIQQQNVGQQQGLQQNIGQQNLGHQQNIGQQQNMGQQSHQQQQLTQSQQFDQMMAQQQQQQQQQMAQQNQQAQQQQVMSQHFGQGQQQPNVTSQPSSMNPIHSQGNLGNPQNVSLQQQVVSSQMGAISVGNINSTGMTQVGNQPGQPIYSNPQLVQNQGMPSAEFEGQQNQAAAQMKDRKIIWRGLLEWQEKVKPGGPQQPKVSRQLQCHLSIGHSDPDINASNWPKELIMQLIPQSLLSSTQLQPLFKNSRQVAFHFGSHNLEALKNLYKVMGTGFAGCVHFPSPSQCDVRVLLLLFSNKRKAFIGLIPNDQTAFVQGIRTVIYSHKMKVGLQQKQQNMLQQAAGAQMPASNMQFPGQQPNMLPQGMSQNQFNMQQQPANTMQNTVMQSQPPGMQKQISQQNMARQQAEVQQQQKLEVTSSVLECEVCRETENANTVVQCCDGHLVCSKCVEKQVKLVLDPSNKENVVSCPAENCLTYIPESQAKKVLPNLIMELLQEKFHKQAMETITKMEDLHSCPFCGFAVLVETEIKEFECWNCKKKSCRYCKRPWQFADHSSCDRFTTQEDDSEEFTLPKYWHPMEGAANESFLTVQLDPNSREFSRVHDLCKNALKKVTSIRRIQNPRLWQKFSLTKKHMLEDIGRQQLNEKQLFHGTNYMAIEGICKDGLDWRMCGVNGTSFGQGTYFAKDASYSDRYCHVVNTLDFGQGTNTVIVPNQQQPFTFGQSSGQNNAGSGFGVNPQLMAQLQQLHGNTWISSHNINANVYNPSKPPVLRVPKNFLFSSQNNVGLIFGAGTGSGTGNQQSGTPSFGQGGAQQQQPQQQQPTFGAAPLAPGFGTANPGFGAQNPAKFGTPNPGFGAQNPAKFGTPNPGFGAQNPASGFGTITYGTTFGQKPAAGPCDSTQNDNTEGVTSNIQKILKKGHKYLFIARVLVGKSAPGASGLRKPPVDQADPKKRHFNSCVNQVQSPSIFVIFDSSQCYPEYLVEYQVSGRKGPH